MKLFMSREDLITELNDLAGDAEAHVPDINNGGCCVFAVMATKLLHRIIEPLRVRIRLLEYKDSYWASEVDVPLSRIRERFEINCMSNWSANSVSFNHVFLEIRMGDELTHFDSTGVHPLKYSDNNGRNTHSSISTNWYIREGELSLEDAEELAATPNWNRRFERNYIPRLQEVFDVVEERIKSNYQNHDYWASYTSRVYRDQHYALAA